MCSCQKDIRERYKCHLKHRFSLCGIPTQHHKEELPHMGLVVGKQLVCGCKHLLQSCNCRLCRHSDRHIEDWRCSHRCKPRSYLPGQCSPQISCKHQEDWELSNRLGSDQRSQECVCSHIYHFHSHPKCKGCHHLDNKVAQCCRLQQQDRRQKDGKLNGNTWGRIPQPGTPCIYQCIEWERACNHCPRSWSYHRSPGCMGHCHRNSSPLGHKDIPSERRIQAQHWQSMAHVGSGMVRCGILGSRNSQCYKHCHHCNSLVRASIQLSHHNHSKCKHHEGTLCPRCCIHSRRPLDHKWRHDMHPMGGKKDRCIRHHRHNTHGMSRNPDPSLECRCSPPLETRWLGVLHECY